MFAATGSLSAEGPLHWSLVFARQPEPDLEFTEEELEQTTNVRSSSPMKTPKKSGGRPLMWLLLLLLVAGGAYVAMEPEMITDFIAQMLGESPAPPPPMAARPPAPMPAPSAPQPAPGAPPSAGAPATEPGAPAPVPPPAPIPPASGPMASAPSPSSAPSPAPPMPAPPAAAAPAMSTPPSPLFGEGQKVTVVLAPGTPGDTVTLMQDAAGTRPGPAVRPGATLTILDGDFQEGGWVYSVRADDGAKGWIGEKRLRLKP